MNEVWNLDPIFKGFDDPAFDADRDEIRRTLPEKLRSPPSGKNSRSFKAVCRRAAGMRVNF